MYLLFGNTYNWPLTDFWSFDLNTRKWENFYNFDSLGSQICIFMAFFPGSDENIIISTIKDNIFIGIYK